MGGRLRKCGRRNGAADNTSAPGWCVCAGMPLSCPFSGAEAATVSAQGARTHHTSQAGASETVVSAEHAPPRGQGERAARKLPALVLVPCCTCCLKSDYKPVFIRGNPFFAISHLQYSPSLFQLSIVFLLLPPFFFVT